MIYTKVFATPEEIEALIKPHAYLVFGSIRDKSVPGGFKPVESESQIEHCHRLALAHGLPEIQGYYGCDLRTGEFVRE